MRQPRFAGYVASKSALDGALQSIAAEAQAHGVSTSSVYMPLVQTKMVESKGHTYDHLYLLTLDEACALIERAIITKEQEVMDLPSRVVNLAYLFVPCLVTAIMAAVYKGEREMPPDQAAATMNPTRPPRKPWKTPLALRALGSFLWLVHVIEAPLTVVIYLLSPLLVAIFAACVLVRDFIFFSRRLSAELRVAVGKAKFAVMFAPETRLLEVAVNGDKSKGGERAALLKSGYVLMEGGVP